MTDLLLIVADALLGLIALIALYNLLDRKWRTVQGVWLRIRRKVFRR